MKSESIEMPSEATQQARWTRDECILCGDTMPENAGYSMQYCSARCRVAMTKLRRQDAAQRAVME
jgi:predicted nucleic acid-binding Zn ribbon protein